MGATIVEAQKSVPELVPTNDTGTVARRTRSKKNSENVPPVKN
jgi:hypothetical protein